MKLLTRILTVGLICLSIFSRARAAAIDVEPADFDVYLAAPLFTQAERDEVEALAKHLNAAGLSVFIPHRDGFLLTKLREFLIKKQKLSADDAVLLVSRAVDALDTFMVIKGTRSLVMNANGRVPDEGAVTELAMAWMVGKPTVLYSDDVRSLTNGVMNPLLRGRADFVTVQRPEEIAPLLSAQLARAQTDLFVPLLPPGVAQRVRQGEQLWNVLKGARAARLENEDLQEVLAQAMSTIMSCAHLAVAF